MLTFLLIVIAGLLIYFICIIAERTKKKEAEEKAVLWNQVLPGYKGKNCEITVKDPLVYIDVMHSVKGLIVDVDDEWIMMECREKKKTVRKVLRITNISSVKEIL